MPPPLNPILRGGGTRSKQRGSLQSKLGDPAKISLQKAHESKLLSTSTVLYSSYRGARRQGPRQHSACSRPAGGDPLSPILRGSCTQCGAAMAVDAHLPPLPGGSTHFDRHKYTVAAGVGSAATAAIVKGGGRSRGGRISLARRSQAAGPDSWLVGVADGLVGGRTSLARRPPPRRRGRGRTETLNAALSSGASCRVSALPAMTVATGTTTCLCTTSRAIEGALPAPPYGRSERRRVVHGAAGARRGQPPCHPRALARRPP